MEKSVYRANYITKKCGNYLTSWGVRQERKAEASPGCFKGIVALHRHWRRGHVLFGGVAISRTNQQQRKKEIKKTINF